MAFTRITAWRRTLLSALVASFLGMPSASAAAPFELTTFAGLPRATLDAYGGVTAWRNLGARVQSTYADAEISVPYCFAAFARTAIAGDATARYGACAGSQELARGHGEHHLALTFKLPQLHGLPYVDVAVRHWRAPSFDASEMERRSGAAWSAIATQPVGVADVIGGYEAMFGPAGDSGRWRTLFAGLAWRTATDVDVEIVGERAVNDLSGAIDRAVTLRLAKRFDAATRFAAWGSRSSNDSSGPWRFGLGLEVSY